MIRRDITAKLQPNWTNCDWKDKRVYLRSIFTRMEIAKASRENLEEFLIVLANTIHTGDQKYKEETECFATVVRHLLQVCIQEELHQRSVRISRWALGISIAALALSVGHELHSWQTAPQPPAPAVVRPVAPSTTPEKK